jgi:type I restriction enzyme S subunit
VFGSIGKKDFHAISVARAPHDLVQEFEILASPLDDRVALCEREARTLTVLRDTLLPKLISGEIRVPEAEAEIEAVV